jgi:hypothetical protein
MKKGLWLVLLLTLPGIAFADNGDLTADQRWTETADGSLALPSSTDAAQAFNLGFGGDLSVGYRLDRTFTLAVASGYYQYDLSKPNVGENGNFSYVPLLGVVRINLTHEPVRPYLFLGLGVAINSYSVTPGGQSSKYTSNQTDFLAAPGVGVLFKVSDSAALFLQGRIDVDFTPANGLGGTDSPTIFIPLQAGIGFFVL